MAGLALSSLRVGQKYKMTNFGDYYEFTVLRNLSDKDFQLKDLISLESYKISELLKFGRGHDFEIRELKG